MSRGSLMQMQSHMRLPLSLKCPGHGSRDLCTLFAADDVQG